MMTSKANVKPFLRWAGSKRKLLPILSSHLPKAFDRYVEPFAGSACLYFHLAPTRALLGDINSELINTYQQVKSNLADLMAELNRFDGRHEKTYYKVRSIQPNELSKLKRAARFIYLNRLCFNGLYRTNTKGQFNVPFGGAKAGQLPSLDHLKSVSVALRGTRLISGSFEKVLAQVVPGDFVYLDPPYSISNRRVFNNYSTDVFGLSNLAKLRTEMVRLDQLGIPFLLSYGVSQEGLALAQGFRTRQAIVQRQISGFAAHRRRAREMLVSNF